MLNRSAIQAYAGSVKAGRVPGRDAEAAEDIFIAAQLGTDIALMGGEIEQLQNER